MKKFVFYHILDKKREPINKITAEDEYQAIQIFAEMKKLSIEGFNKLYNVKEETTNGHSY